MTYFYYIADQIAHRAAAHLVHDRRPGQVPGHQPGRHRRRTWSTRARRRTSPTRPTRTTGRPACPRSKTVNYPAFTSNDTANTYLANGQAQWGSQFIPSIQKFYLDKSPNNHYWFPPVANVTLFINLKNPILSNVAVRQAMAYAINRQQVSKIGEYGYEPPSNQTGIVTPTFSSWQDTSQAAKFGNAYAYNPSQAESRS